jgi:hypothetical protein
VSFTITVKEQLPPIAVVQLTVVVPTGKKSPEAGTQTTVPQAGGAVAEKVTVAPHWPGALLAAMLAGQEIGQPSTLTVKEQSASGLSGLASIAVQFTVVVPSGKQEPEGGTQVTVALPQLSVAISV